MFRGRLNIGLTHKIVEIGGINEGLTLEEWYFKVVEFERARQVTKDIFGRQIIKLLGLASKIE